MAEPNLTDSALASDPYAAIRSLGADAFVHRDAEYGENEAGTYQTGAAGYVPGDQLAAQLQQSGFGTKYQQVQDLGDGRLAVRMQLPGGHKYDTMDVVYQRNAQGGYDMVGEPAPRRETSSGEEQWRDPIEGAAPVILAAAGGALGSIYGAGAAGEVGAAGAGADFGAAAEAGTTAGGGGAAAAGGGGAATTSGGEATIAAEGSGFAGPSGELAGATGGDVAGAGSYGSGATPGGTLTGTGTIGGGEAAAAGAGGSALTSAGSSGTGTRSGTGGGMPDMTMQNWLQLGSMLYGAYQGDRARQGAEDAAAQGAADAAAAREQLGGIANRQLTLAETQYADQQALLARLMPQFEQQMQLAMTEQQRSIERGDAAWADYNAVWRPTEAALAQRSREMADPARIEQQAQRAGEATIGQFDAARTAARREMTAAGMSPDRIAAFEAASRLEEAKAVGGSVDTARRAGETQAVSYLDNAARFGRSLPSQGLATAALAGQQGGQAMAAGGQMQGATAVPAQITSNLLSGAANTAGAGARIGLAGSDLARQGFNDSLAFYGDLIGAGANLWGMNSRSPR